LRKRFAAQGLLRPRSPTPQQEAWPCAATSMANRGWAPVRREAPTQAMRPEEPQMTFTHAFALAVALAAGVASADASAQDVVLGASVQLTGSMANTGRYYRDAYQLAVDKINAAGGVKIGGQAHRLALKLYDNQSDVSLSVRQYTQLVSQDKVALLLGPF